MDWKARGKFNSKRKHDKFEANDNFRAQSSEKLTILEYGLRLSKLDCVEVHHGFLTLKGSTSDLKSLGFQFHG